MNLFGNDPADTSFFGNLEETPLPSASKAKPTPVKDITDLDTLDDIEEYLSSLS